MRDYQPDISQMLTLYQQLEDDVIASMTKRMLKMDLVSESTKYEAEILQASGLLYDDILSLIAGRTDTAKQHVKALFEDAGVQTIAIDNQIHAKAGAVPVAIRQDVGMRRILEAGYRKTLGIMKNLVSTTANLAQNAFISACDRAYMQVSSGAFSYQQAIRQAVKHFGDTGAKIQYPSGHTDRLDVAMRRAVLTGVGQTSAMVSLERAKQAGCYLMELTAHSGSRPEHVVWQGQLVSLTGKDVGRTIDGLHVFSLEQIGYQTGAGFKGWNCRHNWHPYYVGLSIPNYTKEQLAGLDAKNIAYNGKMYSEYEISQMQRAAERKVRALKRQVIASQTALQNAPDSETKSGLQADYTQNAVKLKSAERRLKEFCKQTGRRNDTFRTQVDGFGRSEAQKAVWADKKAQENITSTLSQSDSDFINRFINNVTGKSYMNVVNEFAKTLPNMENKTVSSIFQNAYNNANFEKSTRKNSYFNGKDGKVYIAKNATPSTIAHELFHKIDHDNNIVKNGLLDNCIKNDYENIKNIAKKAGLSLEDMLYLKYPEAFEEKGIVKEEYRGFSDIINGMTQGTVNLGYYHKSSYWEKHLKLQKETFAQYGRFYYDNNPDVIKLVNEMFPETSKQMEQITNIIVRFGG